MKDQKFEITFWEMILQMLDFILTLRNVIQKRILQSF